jgi:hypothetical protein
MTFRIDRNYNAIPCTVDYTVYDASWNVLFNESVSNPPGPQPTIQTGTPAWIKFSVGGNQFRFPVDCCCPFEVYLTCTYSSAFHPFKACLTEDPSFQADLLLSIEM